MTERLHSQFSLSCIGEGNGNPLQCSCLENPRDRGAWWPAICGVAQSRTRPKRLCSISNVQKFQLFYITNIFQHPASLIVASIVILHCDLNLYFLIINVEKEIPTPVFLPGKFHGQRSLVSYTIHGVTNSQT